MAQVCLVLFSYFLDVQAVDDTTEDDHSLYHIPVHCAVLYHVDGADILRALQ
jgi:hypothetical protein